MPSKTYRPARPFGLPRIVRLPLRDLSVSRLFRGGRPTDLGRLPRYAGIFSIGVACIWMPISSYLATAPLRYTSHLSLILPGSGASSSVSLSQIGQASSFANSAFSNGSVSPTETYKRLLGAERILTAASGSMGMQSRDFGQARIELVDQTGLIHVAITGNSPEDAQARNQALLAAFFSEIEALRANEVRMRQDSGQSAIDEYRNSVIATRAEISALQRESGLISAEQYDALVAEADALARATRDLSVTLDEKTKAVERLEAALDTSPHLAAAALRLHADTQFVALTEEMSLRATELSQLRGRFGERHPQVASARAGHAAAETEANIRAKMLTGLSAEELTTLDISHVGSRAALLSDLVKLDAERAGLIAEHDAMTTRLQTSQARKLALIDVAARLEDLQRDFSVSEAVFASAMAKSQTSKTDLYASYPLVQVLEDPSLPVEPSSPRRKLALAAGIAATFFLFMGLLLGWLRRPLIGSLLHEGRTAPSTPGHMVAAE
ncbi:hypothetical protein DL237_04080 [Pseudooceanicola sediminis]|uniref:Lipopolysaccharide biosynthesis protein n=1 Tax=Pseudooceanicola sediminis TaxID=2211117 RepID=A0A399J6I3_9RHOB|nr:hypothetical protein [Pseudooceanicola sediminis]KAA2314254.1 hypothetical protein E0K93_11475 [Puniceibacterium sp. HSS470]RII39889.1 hypothetical protein DL237_04080 [Pseudooceanicola sediminis]|tara:strand:- start:30168 stop:31658 length:1491 start_codon:yes stop_codon:yes gene_type:complete